MELRGAPSICPFIPVLKRRSERPAEGPDAVPTGTKLAPGIEPFMDDEENDDGAAQPDLTLG